MSICMRHFDILDGGKLGVGVELIFYWRPRAIPTLGPIRAFLSLAQDDRTTLPDAYTYTAERDAPVSCDG